MGEPHHESQQDLIEPQILRSQQTTPTSRFSYYLYFSYEFDTLDLSNAPLMVLSS